MVPSIVPIYAGILSLVYLGLTVRIPRARRALRIPVGHGDSSKLQRMIRAHGNFAEYAPFILLLMLLLELRPAPAALLHAAGVLLVASRIVHAYGVSQEKENLNIRIAGMVSTFLLLFVLGALNLYYSLALLLAA